MRSGGEIVDRQMAAPGEEAIRVATRDTTIRPPREELTFG